MGVDRVAKQRAARFPGPSSAPRDRVIGRIPVPVGFQAGHVGPTRKPRGLQGLELRQPGAVAILEDGEDLSTACLCGGLQLVCLVERPHDRLFTDDVLARLQRLHGHGEMQMRRQANVDEVDRGIGQHSLQIIRNRNTGIATRGLHRARGVEIAKRGHREPLWQGTIALKVFGPDPGPYDGDADHARASAMACAVRASSQTLKTWA